MAFARAGHALGCGAALCHAHIYWKFVMWRARGAEETGVKEKRTKLRGTWGWEVREVSGCPPSRAHAPAARVAQTRLKRVVGSARMGLGQYEYYVIIAGG